MKTREPGGTPFADQVRQILLDPDNKALSPHLELLLYEVARQDHVDRVIRPALTRGEIVLCDRFTDATVAYQGFGRGLSEEMIKRMNRQATGGLRPDQTILLDLPATVGLGRAQRRIRELKRSSGLASAENRFENERLGLHQKIRRGYLTLARREGKRFLVVDAAQDPQKIFATIRQRIETTVRGRIRRPRGRRR